MRSAARTDFWMGWLTWPGPFPSLMGEAGHAPDAFGRTGASPPPSLSVMGLFLFFRFPLGGRKFLCLKSGTAPIAITMPAWV